jgi:hypothetical protein
VVSEYIDMFDMFASKYWVRPGFTIGYTTVAADQGGLGGFAPTEGLRRGQFIGTYIGNSWRRVSPFSGPYTGPDDYVMEFGDWRWTPQRRRSSNTHEWIATHPVSALQEPVAGTRANCIFKSFTKPAMVGLSGREPIALVAVYSAQDIGGCEELFVHYGNAKRRDYDVGEPALPLTLKDIPAAELPRCWTTDASSFHFRAFARM